MRGLIPARAGNTSMRFSFFGVTGAHPRSRGEHIDLPPGQYTARGSSPLARGTQTVIAKGQNITGLIPARAGNTSHGFLRLPGRRAHPRSRGEHWILARPGLWISGSSPLARGTQLAGSSSSSLWGLIPARAGNTMFFAFYVFRVGAHPRSRGEHLDSL